tara:strand:- start:30980 stop:31795 length:816 start_codon:yes stop_codon:yes gene_type:complete
VEITNIFIGILEIFKLNFANFVQIFNSISPEYTWIIFLFFCLSTILIFLKIFGEIGIYIYTSIAIIAANIQILKLVKFSFFIEPIALGTILFSTTFVCTDILVEHYGIKKARKNIYIGFSSFLLMNFFMLFTLGFTPLDFDTYSQEYLWAIDNHNYLLNIFLPLPIFFAASMISYLISQFFDVWFYNFILRITNKKYLWFRNNLSTIISSLIDNFIFSILAWIIFNPEPLDFFVVLFTYVLGTYILRVFIAIIDTPFLYIARFIVPKNLNE